MSRIVETNRYFGVCQYCGKDVYPEKSIEEAEGSLRSHEADCTMNPENECCGSCKTFKLKTAFQYNDNDWVYGAPEDDVAKRYKLCQKVDVIVFKGTPGCKYYRKIESD